MFLSDQMPDIRQYEHTWQKVQALYEYMHGLKNRLNHVLSNIGEENLSDELAETINGLVQAAGEIDRLKLTEQSMKAAAWPIGAVYMTADETRTPDKTIGGRWTKLDAAPMNGVTAWKRTE